MFGGTFFQTCCCQAESEVPGYVDFIDVASLSEDPSGMALFDEKMNAPMLLKASALGELRRPGGVVAAKCRAQAGGMDNILECRENQPNPNWTTLFTPRTRGCTLLSEYGGARIQARYYIDKEICTFTLSFVFESQPLEVVCPIPCIEDIYQVDDGDDCFPPGVFNSIAPNEQDYLFMVVFSDTFALDVRKNTGFNSLCLLEETKEGRDRLLEQLKVLHVEGCRTTEQSGLPYNTASI